MVVPSNVFFTKKVQVNYPSVFEVAREPPQDALVYLACELQL